MLDAEAGHPIAPCAAIVAAAVDWSTAHTHGGDRRSERAANLPVDDASLASQSARAAMSGVGERTQRKADKVAKADPAMA